METISARVEREIFEEFERERTAAGMSRSDALRQAVEWWIERRREEGDDYRSRAEQRQRQLLNRMDYLTGVIREMERNLLSGDPEDQETLKDRLRRRGQQRRS